MPIRSFRPFSRQLILSALIGLAVFLPIWGWAGDDVVESVYLSEDDFLSNAFKGEIPAKSFLWLKGDLGESVKSILGHRYRKLRVAYWQKEKRTAWILEEIGKVKPITVGFVVEEGKIETMRVLVYRESHGWEVRYPFFTDQFEEAALTETTDSLDREIDGISGATLSVNAITRLARMVLVLAKHITPMEEEAS